MRYQYLLNGSTPDGTSAYATILTYFFTAEGLTVTPSSDMIFLARASALVNPFSSTTFTATTASVPNPRKSAIPTPSPTAVLEVNQYFADTKYYPCFIDAIATQLNVSASVGEA